jgi:hypothetical protein
MKSLALALSLTAFLASALTVIVQSPADARYYGKHRPYHYRVLHPPRAYYRGPAHWAVPLNCADPGPVGGCRSAPARDNTPPPSVGGQ